MRKLLFLSIALSLKVCFAFSEYPHEKYIATSPYIIVSACVNGVEYIIINGRIRLSVNKDRTIKQCNY